MQIQWMSVVYVHSHVDDFLDDPFHSVLLTTLTSQMQLPVLVF